MVPKLGSGAWSRPSARAAGTQLPPRVCLGEAKADSELRVKFLIVYIVKRDACPYGPLIRIRNGRRGGSGWDNHSKLFVFVFVFCVHGRGGIGGPSLLRNNISTRRWGTIR